MLTLGAVFLFIGISSASSGCFFRNGDAAVIGPQYYVPCPGLDSCCLPTDTCVSNGLCQDINNHANGSLTDEGNGLFANFTGLYQTPACSNQNFDGCDIECTNANATGRAYIWACNAALTSYCCADSFAQESCCSGDSNFVLASASIVSWTSSTSSVSSSVPATTSSSAATPTASTATATPSATHGASLSPGTKAGIGVGVAAGALLLLTVAAYVLWRRTVRRRQLPTNTTTMTEQQEPLGQSKAAGAQEKMGNTEYFAAEVDGSRPPAELEGYGRVELEGADKGLQDRNG